MTITPALAREIADLLGHPPRREEADRRHAIITALDVFADPRAGGGVNCQYTGPKGGPLAQAGSS